jgi:hypothetical protein
MYQCWSTIDRCRIYSRSLEIECRLSLIYSWSTYINYKAILIVNFIADHSWSIADHSWSIVNYGWFIINGADYCWSIADNGWSSANMHWSLMLIWIKLHFGHFMFYLILSWLNLLWILADLVQICYRSSMLI